MPHVKRRATAFLVMTIIAIFVLTAAFVLLMTTRPAWSEEAPQYTCEDVRRLIAEKGKVAAIAFAIEHGISIRQIWQIRRVCKV